MIRLYLLRIVITASAALLIVSSCPFPSFSQYEYGEFYGEKELVEYLPIGERQTYYALRYLMNKYQRRQFLLLETSEQRAAWMERFWIQLDPTPTTRRNERKIEHERRVDKAIANYWRTESPGWDRRGEVLIRFGPPDHKERTWAHIGYGGQRSPGVIWYYFSLGFLVSFVDEFLNGNYTYFKDHYSFDYLDFIRRENIAHDARAQLEKAEGERKIDSGPIVSMVLPQHMDPHFEYPIYAMNPNFIEHYAAGVYSRRLLSEAEKNIPTRFDYCWADKAADNFFAYLKERPFLHTCDLIESRLPTFFDVTAFRGGPGIVRAEVNFEVPAHALDFRETGGAHRAKVDLSVCVSDYAMREVDFAEGEIVAAAPTEENVHGANLHPGQVILSLEPGYYRLAVEAVDRRTGRRGSHTTNLELGCLDTCLVLSDIQFASSVRETDEGGRFVKGNLEVVPHPLRAYLKPFPLIFYFEIYGLDTDREGLAFYSIEYSIIPLEKRRWGPVLKEITTAVSSKFRTTGYGSTQPQRLEIATDDLWKGAFMLKVTVTDRRSFGVAHKSARFSIVE
jgi:GWxTD domain-containing protein